MAYARSSFTSTYRDSNPHFPANIPAFTFNNVAVDYIFAPRTKRTANTLQLIHNLTWTKGAHIFKFRGNMRSYQ